MKEKDMYRIKFSCQVPMGRRCDFENSIKEYCFKYNLKHYIEKTSGLFSSTYYIRIEANKSHVENINQWLECIGQEEE